MALEMRCRVKEQLKKLGGKLIIPEGMCNRGNVCTVSRGKSGMIEEGRENEKDKRLAACEE